MQLMPSHFKSHRILLEVALLLFKLLPTQHALQLSRHRLLPVSYNTPLQCEWRARHSPGGGGGEGSAQATPGTIMTWMTCKVNIHPTWRTANTHPTPLQCSACLFLHSTKPAAHS